MVFLVNKQAISFMLVGLLNTIFYYIVYSTIIFFGYDYKLAVFIATIIGIIFSFNTFKKFVFTNASSYGNKLFYKFLAAYIILYLVNIIFIKVFYNMGADYYYAGFFAIFPYTVLSFLSNKFYVFAEINKV